MKLYNKYLFSLLLLFSIKIYSNTVNDNDTETRSFYSAGVQSLLTQKEFDNLQSVIFNNIFQAFQPYITFDQFNKSFFLDNSFNLIGSAVDYDSLDDNCIYSTAGKNNILHITNNGSDSFTVSSGEGNNVTNGSVGDKSGSASHVFSTGMINVISNGQIGKFSGTQSAIHSCGFFNKIDNGGVGNYSGAYSSILSSGCSNVISNGGDTFADDFFSVYQAGKNAGKNSQIYSSGYGNVIINSGTSKNSDEKLNFPASFSQIYSAGQSNRINNGGGGAFSGISSTISSCGQLNTIINGGDITVDNELIQSNICVGKASQIYSSGIANSITNTGTKINAGACNQIYSSGSNNIINNQGNDTIDNVGSDDASSSYNQIYLGGTLNSLLSIGESQDANIGNQFYLAGNGNCINNNAYEKTSGSYNYICLSGSANTITNAGLSTDGATGSHISLSGYVNIVSNNGNGQYAGSYLNISSNGESNNIYNAGTGNFSGYSSLIMLSGKSNTVNNGNDIEDSLSSDYSGAHSTIIANGTNNIINNRSSVENQTVNNTIISNGSCTYITNTSSNSIIIATGSGSLLNPHFYTSYLDQSICLSANIGGYIVFDPQSIPDYNNEQYVLCYDARTGKVTKIAINRFVNGPSKQNITDIETNEKFINNLHEVMFDYILSVRKGRKAIGYVAEDLIGTPFEFAIIYDNDGLPESIDYTSIFVYLFAFYKNHTQSQDERLYALENKYEQLCNLIENMQKH